MALARSQTALSDMLETPAIVHRLVKHCRISAPPASHGPER